MDYDKIYDDKYREVTWRHAGKEKLGEVSSKL
jgi:hypothetical protein